MKSGHQNICDEKVYFEIIAFVTRDVIAFNVFNRNACKIVWK